MSMHASLRTDTGETRSAAHRGQALSAPRKRACQRENKKRIQAAADAAGQTVAQYLQATALMYQSAPRQIIRPENIVYETYGYRGTADRRDDGWHSTSSGGISRLGRPGSRLWDD